MDRRTESEQRRQLTHKRPHAGRARATERIHEGWQQEWNARTTECPFLDRQATCIWNDRTDGCVDEQSRDTRPQCPTGASRSQLRHDRECTLTADARIVRVAAAVLLKFNLRSISPQ